MKRLKKKKKEETFLPSHALHDYGKQCRLGKRRHPAVSTQDMRNRKSVLTWRTPIGMRTRRDDNSELGVLILTSSVTTWSGCIWRQYEFTSVNVAAGYFYRTFPSLCFLPLTQDIILLGLIWQAFIKPRPILASQSILINRWGRVCFL